MNILTGNHRFSHEKWEWLVIFPLNILKPINWLMCPSIVNHETTSPDAHKMLLEYGFLHIYPMFMAQPCRSAFQHHARTRRVRRVRPLPWTPMHRGLGLEWYCMSARGSAEICGKSGTHWDYINYIVGIVDNSGYSGIFQPCLITRG